MVKHSRLFAVLIIAYSLSGHFLTACADREELPPSSARVLDIVDGDTVVVSVKGHRITVRLIGIDTPETKKPATPVECYGPEATDFLYSLIPPGTILDVQRDTESRDHFGRLLAYLFRRDDGLFVNREILVHGFARTLSIPPNTTYSLEFELAATRARRELKGLWKACAPAAAGHLPSNGTTPATSPQ